MSVRLITSRDNAQYKQLRQLARSAQARRKSGRTLLDGVHLCQAWLEHRGAPLLCVAGESARTHAEVAAVLAACDQRGAECLVLPDAMFAPLSQVEHGVPLMFVVAPPVPEQSLTLDGASLLLDGLQDPGNLGSILRSAAAAGMVRVFCGRGTVSAWSPKVLRAGMGAHFVLDIVEDADLPSLVADATVPVYATSSHASMTIHDADLRTPSAWLFGHEGQGVSAPLLALATRQLSIPQASAVESLNVAASVAVCLFEQLRQQRSSTSR
jgi:TrmH family RNA methyltransferase